MPAARRRVILTIGALTLFAHPTVGPRGEDVGVLKGAHLIPHEGTLHVTEDNAVVRNMEIRGDVIVDADNISMCNVRILSTTQGSALRINDGADGFLLADSEIDGYGTFLRNRIHGAENGINVTGPSLIKANYTYGLRTACPIMTGSRWMGARRRDRPKHHHELEYTNLGGHAG